MNSQNQITSSITLPFSDGDKLLIETSPDNSEWTRLVYVEGGGMRDELIAFPSTEVGMLIIALKAYKEQMDQIKEG